MALFYKQDFRGMWDALMARLLANPEYVALFTAAYPDTPPAEWGFQHAANAIAAFETDAFTLLNSPWDRYLAGDTTALSEAAQRGALLFYGDAGCANCHSGPLMSDQRHHNLAVPQVGPGKGEESPLDFGRARETNELADRYAFRTPPLRNVAITGPYMHDGAYDTLETAVRHHLDPVNTLRQYDPAVYLPPELWGAFQNDAALLVEMSSTVDPLLSPARPLSDADIADLLAFLESLTDPAALKLDTVIPATVPSGLPVEDSPSLSAN